MFKTSAVCLAAVLCLGATGFSGSGLKLKKLKPAANSANYLKFSQPIPKQDQIRHALNRLTFGARPGDEESVKEIGLKRWLELQLHPEREPEDPKLEAQLAQLKSLPLSIHETYLQYPPPRLIAQFARGLGTLPEDPDLRSLIVHLSERYLQKKDVSARTILASNGTQGPVADQNDQSDLELRVKLPAILGPQQIRVLQGGQTEEKRQVLASIPPDKQLDFAWALRPAERRKLYNLAPVALRRELMLTVNPEAVVLSDLSEGKVLRAISSSHQLAELLDDFWFNHFNIFANKGSDRFLVPTYERVAIRPHVLGNFYDLLLATAKSPAMLFYLDNWESVAERSDGASTRRRKTAQRGLNENYGRELLELHTLGVDGGYTQKDVTEVARCFTGWTIAGPRKGGGFEYNDKVHDKGQKIVLGHVIAAGGGMNDGLEVLKLLAHHPKTAHFISLKLAQRFVADDPPPSLVARMSKTFLKSGGDLRAVMETMLSSPEFWSEGAYEAKIKTPFEMVVSAVRTTNASVSSAYALANEIQKLGEPLYRKIEPTGYSSANAEWVNSGALLERMNFALALAHNRVPGVEVNTQIWRMEGKGDAVALASDILDGEPSPQTIAAINKTLADEQLQQQIASAAKIGAPQVPGLVAGLALGSPEFQHR